MKHLLFFVCCFAMGYAQGQNQKPLDTLFANDRKTVALFFPKPIVQGVVGKDHFVFSFHKKTPSTMALLQASPGVESNLIAITEDGQIYSYILRYSKTLSKLHYFVKQQQSIGNVIPKAMETVLVKKTKPQTNLGNLFSLDPYETDCATFLKNSARSKNKSKRKYQIQFSIKDVVFRKDNYYYLLEIANNSAISYRVDYLRFFSQNKTGLTKKSVQTLPINPIYQYHFPKTVAAHTKVAFVMVLPKYSLNAQKEVFVELKEFKGERDLVLRKL